MNNEAPASLASPINHTWVMILLGLLWLPMGNIIFELKPSSDARRVYLTFIALQIEGVQSRRAQNGTNHISQPGIIGDDNV